MLILRFMETIPHQSSIRFKTDKEYILEILFVAFIIYQSLVSIGTSEKLWCHAEGD